MALSKNMLDKIRDLVGMLKGGYLMTGKPVKQSNVYHRYNIGDKVRFFNQDLGAWDEAEIRSERNRGTYQITNPDGDTYLQDWNELRPLD